MTMKLIGNENGKKHLTLIDPEKQDPEKAGKIGKIAEMAGSSGILIGSSTSIDQIQLDSTIEEIKKNCSLKTILFPSSSSMLSSHADAIFFISLLNSADREYLIEAQAKGAMFIKRAKLEVIPVGYIVVGQGEKVGEVGKIIRIEENEVDKIVGYALAAQFFGAKAIYIEKGSGARCPIAKEIVKKIKEELDIPLIIGGGIRNKTQARDLAEGGADYIVTGSIVEEIEIDKLGEVLKGIVNAFRLKG